MALTVIYHANCNDGFTAACILKDAFNFSVLIAGDYRDPTPPPGITEEDEVILVDFSYKRSVLEELRSRVKKLIVLDHHKTAQADLAGLPGVKFDMDQCGATLAFDYVTKAYEGSLIEEFVVSHDARPIFYDPMGQYGEGLEMIRDRDLWLNKLPDTAAFTAGLSMVPKEFDPWIHAIFMDHREVVRKGRAILEYQKKQIKQLVDQHVSLVQWNGHLVPLVNSAAWMSDIGNDLLEKYPKAPFSVVYFIVGDHVKLSLRGASRTWNDGTDVDVSEIAKEFGGGGHKNASGLNTTERHVLEVFGILQ
jgi:nanoRNase/pAp phosphatase (c-di-AMP/oligoRNAs hydrolase)